MRKRKVNPKRRMIKSRDEARLESLAGRVAYTGNPLTRGTQAISGLRPPHSSG